MWPRQPGLSLWSVLAGVVMSVLLVVMAGCGQGRDSEAVYRCPMHPEVVADRPGDCSVCGMRLVAAARCRTGDATRHSDESATRFVCPMHPSVTSPIRAVDRCLSCFTHAVGRMPLAIDLVGAQGELLYELRRT